MAIKKVVPATEATATEAPAVKKVAKVKAAKVKAPRVKGAAFVFYAKGSAAVTVAKLKAKSKDWSGDCLRALGVATE